MCPLRFHHVESRIADAEARVTRSQQALVTRLSKELAEVKATLAAKSARLVEQQQLNRRLCAGVRQLGAHNSVVREV